MLRFLRHLRRSPRAFDLAKRLSRLAGRRTPLYEALLEAQHRHPIQTFIQVGANDGITTDPLREFIVRYGWRGVCVEPLPHLSERLRRNYRHLQHVAVEAAAVSYEPATSATIYRVAPERVPELTGDADQVASFSRDQVLAATKGLVGPEDLVPVEVPVTTIEAIADRHGLEKVDLLHLDIEGHEANVLLNADLPNLRPRILLFEHVHLTPDKRARIEARLDALGYRRTEIDLDQLCVLAGE